MKAEEFYLKEAIFEIPKNRTISKFSYDELIIFAEAYAKQENKELREAATDFMRHVMFDEEHPIAVRLEQALKKEK